MTTSVVFGAGGFIGSHLVRRLKDRGDTVFAYDLKLPEFNATAADEFYIVDLTDPRRFPDVLPRGRIDEVYQLAADMGGAGYIFSGDHDADLMTNSATINLNVARWAKDANVGTLFYSSSACMYPASIQKSASMPGLREEDAYPAAPDSEYGWEKLFSERLFLAYARNHQLNVRIARFHNVYGPEGTYRGGREKAPAAICRKVAEAADDGEIEVWGDGEQTRSFLYIDDCLDGVQALMATDYGEPINIGSDRMVSINQLAAMACEVAGKSLRVKHVAGPLGVRGRNSDNTMCELVTGWKPIVSLEAGIERTYQWVSQQVMS